MVTRAADRLVGHATGAAPYVSGFAGRRQVHQLQVLELDAHVLSGPVNRLQFRRGCATGHLQHRAYQCSPARHALGVTYPEPVLPSFLRRLVEREHDACVSRRVLVLGSTAHLLLDDVIGVAGDLGSRSLTILQSASYRPLRRCSGPHGLRLHTGARVAMLGTSTSHSGPDSPGRLIENPSAVEHSVQFVGIE